MSIDYSYKENYYQAGGALRPDARCYIARSCDREALALLLQQRYVSILGPRQVGKTSLINRLHASLALAGIPSAVVDLSGLIGVGEADWYSTFAAELARQFSSAIDPSAYVHDIFSLTGFLNHLEVVANPEASAVIMLDEAAAVPDTLRTKFYMQWRILLNARPIQQAQEASRFTFVFAGAFYPSELVEDPHVSPFNVSKEIYVPDFTRSEVARLMQGFNEEDLVIDNEAKEEIWYQARGHPFLTQKLCENLSWLARTRNPSDEGKLAVIDRDDVKDVARAMADRDPNLQNLITRLNDKKSLRWVELIGRVLLNQEDIPLNPLVNPAASQLEMIGALTEESGFARVRNPIYERVLRQYLAARTKE